jgi:hypothetical protein
VIPISNNESKKQPQFVNGIFITISSILFPTQALPLAVWQLQRNTQIFRVSGLKITRFGKFNIEPHLTQDKLYVADPAFKLDRQGSPGPQCDRI